MKIMAAKLWRMAKRNNGENNGISDGGVAEILAADEENGGGRETASAK